MGRGYISFEDIEKIVGRENMICFCELMKEKFEQTDEKERIKIEFIEHLLYEDYEASLLQTSCLSWLQS